ncbi:50S ribosomal protein L17 [Candidatus Kaiserbacteria bacterium CG10_big_fil_rev_8_21_14_0_10_43_70]|uniref:50S ribosomal protein L17 n=1 Tax=Candidatus Kaiserbacteria bacterium CG10_big_fil_rev_8_21_14_0_10_43_70 TaxID=1974605 RepID=A0A2H0UIM2_9BACT|nr:MAG: 50S ribosomal protein L17 [Candidatus Kaiserbacteria bacterium CG10_big_fil_rev_8_21_14_0_10_43_70]
MQHHRKKRTLGRDRAQYTALMRSLAREIIIHGSVVTTLAKAKEARPFVEKLITTGKKSTLASQRVIASRLGNSEDIARKIVVDVAPKYKDRSGGYTRIIKLGRTGARMSEEARIELV